MELLINNSFRQTSKLRLVVIHLESADTLDDAFIKLTGEGLSTDEVRPEEAEVLEEV